MEGTGFSNIDHLMSEARQKPAGQGGSGFEIVLKITKPAPTPEELDSDERLDTANTHALKLISEAKAQLAAPRVAPKELTPAEAAEKAAAQKCDENYNKAHELTTRMEQENDQLFQQVADLIDACDKQGVHVERDVNVPPPPPSPKLEWLKDVPIETRKWVAAGKQPFPEDSKAYALPFRREQLPLLKKVRNLSPYKKLHESAGAIMRGIPSLKNTLLTVATAQELSEPRRATETDADERPDWVKKEWVVLGSFDKTYKW